MQTVVEPKYLGLLPPLLEVNDLTVKFGFDERAHVAVKNVDLAVGVGEIVAVVGESGSGKTTLGLAIMHFLSPLTSTVSSSRLVFEGRNVSRLESVVPHKIEGMAMVFQDAMTSLDPVEPIEKQFRAVLQQAGMKSRKHARLKTLEWLIKVGLHDAEAVMALRPWQLSGGMRQRVMVALAMCSEPRLLVADEPTTALDATVSRDVMDLLTKMVRASGASLLIITHDIDLCREYADRMVVMYQGEVLESCPATVEPGSAAHPYTRALLRCVPTLRSYEDERLPTIGSDGFVREVNA